jgi:hypothetical protein
MDFVKQLLCIPTEKKRVGLHLGPEAQSIFDEARRNPDYFGGLDKMRPTRDGWDKDYCFFLKGRFLFYTKDYHDNPWGIINLGQAVVEQVVDDATMFSLRAHKSMSMNSKWTFRTYIFKARNERECQEWINILKGTNKSSTTIVKKLTIK